MTSRRSAVSSALGIAIRIIGLTRSMKRSAANGRG
jgi:hypothetical protein